MTGTSGIAEELIQLQGAHERFFPLFIREGQVWVFGLEERKRLRQFTKNISTQNKQIRFIPEEGKWPTVLGSESDKSSLQPTPPAPPLHPLHHPYTSESIMSCTFCTPHLKLASAVRCLIE